MDRWWGFKVAERITTDGASAANATTMNRSNSPLPIANKASTTLMVASLLFAYVLLITAMTASLPSANMSPMTTSTMAPITVPVLLPFANTTKQLKNVLLMTVSMVPHIISIGHHRNKIQSNGINSDCVNINSRKEPHYCFDWWDFCSNWRSVDCVVSIDEPDPQWNKCKNVKHNAWSRQTAVYFLHRLAAMELSQVKSNQVIHASDK